MDAPIFYVSQNTSDVIPSSNNIEDESFIENPLDFLSTFFQSIEGEFFHFSCTLVFDLSDHEDVNEIIDFTDHSCRDLFTPIFNHDDDSITGDFSKKLVYDDLYVDEFETS